jgi:glycosyltransferase involved in cell wall biosynthesis
MKVLYATRLFSGLETSFINKVWAPTGVPTIYKIIEELDKKHETRFIFSAKDNGDGYSSLWDRRSDHAFTISGLRQSVYILSGVRFFPSWITRKIAMILRDFRQTIVIILVAIKFKPDVIYCDHATIIVAAILSRYQKRTAVVFRAMGVYPFMRQSLEPTNMIHRLYKWAYHSPFDLVICTQDGSGVEMWLDNALSNEVRREVLLNGIDKISLTDTLDEQLQALPKNKNIVLFIGKLERYKGCFEFIESILLLLEKKINKVHALVIGTGSEKKKLKNLVERADRINSFTFIDRLPHKQIAVAHNISDIYVSMNHLGNLSNANLEAIQSNDCMVIPKSQPKTGIDIVTSKLLSKAVVYVPINNPKFLSDALYRLIQSKEERLRMSKDISIKKQNFLWSWKERMAVEMDLLENFIKNKI